MNVSYRLVFGWKHSRAEQLQRLGLAVSVATDYPNNGGVAISYVDEGHPGWSKACRLMKRWGGSMLRTTEFTAEEIAAAEFCVLQPTHYSSYPQPEDDFGFEKVTYDLGEFCEKCGIGRRQAAAFRVRGSLRWGRNDFLQLHWIPGEFFMRTEAWAAHLQPLGVQARHVEDSKGRPVEGLVQLRIDDPVPVDLRQEGSVVCTACAREYHRPIDRGLFPTPVGAPDAPAFRTRQYFGTGRNAFNEIVVRSSVAAAIVAGGLRGVKLWPCALPHARLHHAEGAGLGPDVWQPAGYERRPMSDNTLRMKLSALWSRIRIGVRGRRLSDLRYGEIGTAGDFADLVTPEDIVAARVPLNPGNVPPELRALVSVARHWGIGCDAIRDVVVGSAGDAERIAFAEAVNPHNSRITKWLDSFPQDKPMSAEAAAFMYMQLALTEMRLYQEEEESD